MGGIRGKAGGGGRRALGARTSRGGKPREVGGTREAERRAARRGEPGWGAEGPPPAAMSCPNHPLSPSAAESGARVTSARALIGCRARGGRFKWRSGVGATAEVKGAKGRGECLFAAFSKHTCPLTHGRLLFRFQPPPSHCTCGGRAGGAGLLPLSNKRVVPLCSRLPLWSDCYNLQVFRCVIHVLVPESLHFLLISSRVLRAVCFPPSKQFCHFKSKLAAD